MSQAITKMIPKLNCANSLGTWSLGYGAWNVLFRHFSEGVLGLVLPSSHRETVRDRALDCPQGFEIILVREDKMDWARKWQDCRVFWPTERRHLVLRGIFASMVHRFSCCCNGPERIDRSQEKKDWLVWNTPSVIFFLSPRKSFHTY